MMNGDALDWQHRIDIPRIRRAFGPRTSRNNTDQRRSRRRQDRSQRGRALRKQSFIRPNRARHSCRFRTRRRATDCDIAREESKSNHQNIASPQASIQASIQDRCAFLHPRNGLQIGIQIGHKQSLSYRLKTSINCNLRYR